MGLTKDLFLQIRQEEVTRDRKWDASYINNYFTKPIKQHATTSIQDQSKRGQ